MKINEIDRFLLLWDNNNLEKLWSYLRKLSQEELSFVIAWMTVMIRDESEIRLSQWLVWLETKTNSK